MTLATLTQCRACPGGGKLRRGLCDSCYQRHLRAARGGKPNRTGPCVRCGCVRILRGRGLCWTCHADPEVRWRYARQDGLPEEDCNGGYDLPDEPTTAAPGSPEKLDVLAARYAARRRLWHPEDGGRDG